MANCEENQHQIALLKGRVRTLERELLKLLKTLTSEGKK